MNDEPVLANPAFRFGAQQGLKLRAVDDLKRGATNDATSVSTPITLPSWDHIAQMRALFHLKGSRRPLAMAKTDHADAYKQLPATTKDELAAAATLRHPVDGEWYGFIPHTPALRINRSCATLQLFIEGRSFADLQGAKNPTHRILR